MRIISKVKIRDEREIWFFDLLLCRYSKNKNDKNLKLFPKPYQQNVFDEIIKKVDKKHDGIFVLNAGFGEIYLISFFLEALLKKYKIKNPCFISHREISRELIGLYYPNIPFYLVNRPDKFLSIKNTNNKYRNKFIHINPCTAFEMMNFWEKYLLNLDSRNYVQVMSNFAKVQIKNKPNVIIDDRVKKNAEEKVKSLNLNLNNFVVFFTEANFFSRLDKDVWEKLKLSFLQTGIDVLVNSENFGIQEIYYLVSISKGIVGLRCGLCELFSALEIPKHIIYTKCRRDVKDILQVFSFKNYPYVKKETVFEYEISKESLTVILEKIIIKFNKQEDKSCTNNKSTS